MHLLEEMKFDCILSVYLTKLEPFQIKHKETEWRK